MRTRAYVAWANMKTRCDNPSHDRAASYSQLDITYQASWKNFNSFYADMGDCPPGLQLDRKDNNGHYTTDNCHWVTPADNVRNSTTAKLNAEAVRQIRAEAATITERQGRYNTFKEIGKLFGVSPECIHQVVTNRTWRNV